ncbi:MAG: WS/DGAT/MGAT family O-acyltransferase [Acidimicrobiia bacterium]
METLTGLDATLLKLETPTSHMHMTGVLIFDPATMPGGYSLEKVANFIAGRLHMIPAFRRRLVNVPFGFGRPVWMDDPNFDLEYHIRRAALPAPGGIRELTEFGADVAGRPLDLSKPLWEMWFVEGLEGGNVAMVAKMHHATIDGVSGANLMAHLLDLEPPAAAEGEGDGAANEEWRPEPMPSDIELLGRALVGRARRRLRLVRASGTAIGAFVRILTRRVTGAEGMAAPFSAPSTRFNSAITPHRRIALASAPLESVKHIKNAVGVTVNDVVLSVCGGALRRYLTGRGELPDRSLVAAVPISVREDDDVGGNRISAMFVSLGTDTPDPVQRLRQVSEASRAAKEEHATVGDDLFPDLGEFGASQLLGAGAHLYSRFGLASRHRPVMNAIVSNVPGPSFPLYFAGAKLLALYPLGPVYDGVGLNITVLSYLDSIGFGFVTCAEVAPDLDALADAVNDSLQELEKEASPTP